MDSSDLIPNSFFTRHGNDVWELKSYFEGPSCVLKNLQTGEEEEFGMNGLTAQEFKRIIMPLEGKKGCI